MNYQEIDSLLTSALELNSRPVAISFSKTTPTVRKFEGSEPSGCSYWRLAADGKSFYTVPSDHYNCVIGSHTHNIALPTERQKELMDTLGFMTGIGYIRMEEVPGIPQLKFAPKYISYSPLSDAAISPDVVLVIGKPGKLMLLQEAAIRAGVSAGMPTLGRPTCMAVPAAINGGVTASTGCVGNRVYTNIGDDELYVAIPGNALEKIASELQTIVAANQKLTEFHEQRRATLRHA